MKIVKVVTVLVLSVAIFSGCTARSLSVLQAEFNATVETRKNCQSGTEYEPKKGSLCSVDFQTIFADIAAQSAKSLKDYKGSPSVKISLHRLYAYSLWQSGASEKDDAQAARKGLEECKVESYTKAPRDCALLATIGWLKGIEAAGTGIEEIEQKYWAAENKTTVCTQNAIVWRKEVSDFWRNYFLPLADDMKMVARKEQTPPSALQYLQKQQEKAFDQLEKLKLVGRNCVPDETVVNQLVACPCNPNERSDDDREACDKVFDEENPSYAFYYEAFCSNEDVFKSGECPCGYENRQSLNVQERSACEYVKRNPGAAKLHDTKCQVERALK
jgi:hypothetical protein